MIELDSKMLLEVFVALCSGVGAYAAIRADLARLHERIVSAKEKATDAWEHAENAHKRINDL